MGININEGVLRKIQKALALAKDNSSVHESQTALLLAQKLMLQHGISAADIESKHAQSKEISHSNVTKFGRTPWWKRQLGFIIAQNFRCTMYIKREGTRNRVMFLGLKEDVEIAIQVYQYAEVFLQHHAQEYCRSIKSRIKTRTVYNRYRNKFMMGYLAGLYSKFQEQVKQNDWGLVLVKDEVVLAEEERLNLVPRKLKTPTLSRSKDAFMKGYIKGRQFECPKGLLQ